MPGRRKVIAFILSRQKMALLAFCIWEAAAARAIGWKMFVKPEHQNQGIGTQAIRLAEEIVRTYSVSMYIEAAARNQQAIRLYHRLGYECLNTISVRKDFPGFAYDIKRQETLYGLPFEIRSPKE